ncbi:hypothetical protein [Mycobacterium scrofulaceum]|uniref:Uncharacterized protein n=1 Tax=Mycobacterium scrofulaceum TaxID=1783 RepID=A0A1X0K313_MYCSC|nr:hypothetical protein [Mycobacterium scrofulaceum]ORB69390.1 hypothetical protein BST44_25600 [Mycobacterium scrofulaceum]
MNSSASLAATEPFAAYRHAGAGFFFGLAHESEISPRTAASAVGAKAEAFAARVKAPLIDLKTSWRPSEEDVARAAIAVIFFALVTIISLAAGAILTMGTMG